MFGVLHDRLHQLRQMANGELCACMLACRAAGAGKVEAVKLLLQDQRVGLEARDREGSTPLLVAVESGQAPVVLYLASVGADLQVMALSHCKVTIASACKASAFGDCCAHILQ